MLSVWRQWRVSNREMRRIRPLLLFCSQGSGRIECCEILPCAFELHRSLYLNRWLNIKSLTKYSGINCFRNKVFFFGSRYILDCWFLRREQNTFRLVCQTVFRIRRNLVHIFPRTSAFVVFCLNTSLFWESKTLQGDNTYLTLEKINREN